MQRQAEEQHRAQVAELQAKLAATEAAGRQKSESLRAGFAAQQAKLEAAIAVSEALQASAQPQAAEAVLKQSQQVVTPLLDAAFRGENKGNSGFASESAEAAGTGRVDVAELAGGSGGGASELGLWDEAELKRHLAVPFKPLTKRVY